MAKIKICGITSKIEANYINEAKCDYAGFIFAESRRKITKENAYDLRKIINSKIETVGVFVNENIEFIADLCSSGIISLIQLHGNESNDYILQIKKITNKKVVKAFKIDENFNIDIVNNSIADLILFDTAYKNMVGGTGKTFNWDIIKDVKRDYFLAGGINYENVSSAYFKLKPFAFDINSGVEVNYKKDYKKILEITSLIRSLK